MRSNTIGLWDHDRLFQVFSNVVGNAVCHGTSSCRVTIDADGTDSATVHVTVHNEGCVPEDILPMMFEPFRGTTKRHRTSGLGLGLFITRQLVESLGTTLHIRLPRFPASHPTGAKAEL